MQPGSPAEGPVPETGLPAAAEHVTVGGRYQLLARSGADEDTGSGRLSTWRARDNLLQRDVLLRIHAPGGQAARGLLDRALAAGVLSHPALAMVYDAVDEGRRAYVVSEWVEGQSLAQALTGGPLPEAYARETIRRLAEGVAQAHQVGLPVGGLVPERIMLTRSGSVTVGAIPAPAADVDSDLHSLGELLFATMAGFLPVGDDPVELDRQLTNASAPDLADTALAVLEGRVHSAAELVAELVAHRRPGSLGEAGGLSFIIDRYEDDGPSTDVWPTISGPPAEAQAVHAGAAAAAAAGSVASQAATSHSAASEGTTGRPGLGTAVGAPARLWGAARAAGRRARRPRSDHPEQTDHPEQAEQAEQAEPTIGAGGSRRTGTGTPETAAPGGAAAAPRSAGPSSPTVTGPAGPPTTREVPSRSDDPIVGAQAGPATARGAATAGSPPEAPESPPVAHDPTVAIPRRVPGDTQPRPVAVAPPVPPGVSDPLASDTDSGSWAREALFGPSEPDPRDGTDTAADRPDESETQDDDPYADDGEDGPESRRRTWLVLAFFVAALLAVALIGWVLATSFHNVVDQAAPSTGPTQTTTSTAPTTTPAPTATPGPLPVLSATVFDPFGDGAPENNDQSPLAVDGDPGTSWPTLQYRGTAALGNLKPGVGLIFDLGAPALVSQLSITTDQPGATVEIRAGAVPTGTDLEPFPRVGQGELAANGEIAVQGEEPARYWIVWITELVPDGDSFSASLAEVTFTGVSAS